MIHQYQLNGYNIVLDTCSGSIHVVDEVAYDIIALFENHAPDAIVSAMLEKYGSITLTHSEAAALAFGLLDADNKEREYPLRFKDVDAGDNNSHEIAYLESYGFFYGTGENFFPDNQLTRAEFAVLFPRLLFRQYPEWYGDPIEVSDLDVTHWAYDFINGTCKEGWLTIEDGQVRPDDPITAGEIAYALRAVCAGLQPAV